MTFFRCKYVAEDEMETEELQNVAEDEMETEGFQNGEDWCDAKGNSTESFKEYMSTKKENQDFRFCRRALALTWEFNVTDDSKPSECMYFLPYFIKEIEHLSFIKNFMSNYSLRRLGLITVKSIFYFIFWLGRSSS